MIIIILSYHVGLYGLVFLSISGFFSATWRNILPASGASPPEPHRGSAPGPRWGLCPQTPVLVPLPRKPKSWIRPWQVLKSIANYEKSEQVQQANVFKRQTLVFHFSTYRPNSFKQLSRHTPVRPHERIDRYDRCIGRRSNMATRFFFINNTFSSMIKLSTPNMYCWSCKYLSPYTRRISDWMTFALSPFAHSKRITECCSLWDDFNGNVAISNVYKWRHSDVIVIKLIAAHTKN